MKFLFSISVYLILSLVAFDQIHAYCNDLIKQYYECKYLHMSIQNSTWGELDYRPVKSIRNNKLDDKFYRRHGLAKMDFDDGMRLFKKIYDETENCHTKFCKCVSFKHIDNYNNFSILFRNETNYPQVKKIVAGFIRKFKSKLIPYDKVPVPVMYDGPWGPEKNVPTIQKFCYRNDFSWERLMNYNYSALCSNFNYSYVAYLECNWSVNVINKTLSLNYTQSQKEQLFVCNLMNYGNCPREGLRYMALLTWITQFPDLGWRGKSLSSYLDRFIRKAAEFKPRLDFHSASFYSYGDMINTETFDDRWLVYRTNESSFVYNVLNTSQLIIDAEWRYDLNNSNFLAVLNFTFIFDSNESNIVNLTIDLASVWLNFNKLMIENNTIFKDPNGENWIQIFWSEMEYWGSLEIYDFNTNTYININRNGLLVQAPRVLFENGSGAFVDGLNNTYIGPAIDVPLNSARYSFLNDNDGQISCENRCEFILNVKRSSKATHKPTSDAFQACLDRCSRSNF